MEVVKQIYKLRQNFILIGLTGRTGSGCSTVAKVLETENVQDLKSNYRDFNEGDIDNNTRKDRIVHEYIKENWYHFTTISASDVIFFYALLEDFDGFVQAICNPDNLPASDSKFGVDEAMFNLVKAKLKELEGEYNVLHKIATDCNHYLEGKVYNGADAYVTDFLRLVTTEIKHFRSLLRKQLKGTPKQMLSDELQTWGNHIRLYNSILKKDENDFRSPSCLARKINQFIKLFRAKDKYDSSQDFQLHPTHIVIDALRNPYEVLYFRERYSAFYLMSVNTTEKIRRQKLADLNYRIEEIVALDTKEKGDKALQKSFELINIDKCIELSDIFLTHDGTPVEENRDIVNQILTYITLILHPGLIPPSSIERVMQVAYTAKLNSGCLSRQVGAAVTNESYSIQSIGWNTSAEGQTPCSLRNLFDLEKREDENAYSDYEKGRNPFSDYTRDLCDCYRRTPEIAEKMGGLPMPYCFKDIYTSATNQMKNQVHTRSLHAEENAFLQLAKYGTQGIKDGMLFTTASCCELCAKKAYQLGIRKIYYIDTYPGISNEHILGSGPKDHRPEMILFKGAVGRAYINLYNPFMPLKDEIETLSGVEVKKIRLNSGLQAIKKEN